MEERLLLCTGLVTVLEESDEGTQLELKVDSSVLLDVEINGGLLADSTQSTCDKTTLCSSIPMTVVS